LKPMTRSSGDYVNGVSKLDLLQAHLDVEYFTELLGYKNAPHHKAIYEKLRDPRVKRLLIIMPPGHGKSTCVTVNYPLWAVGKNPNLRIIVSSHTKDFVASFIREITARMESQDYKEVFGDLKPARPNKWAQNEIIVRRSTILKDPTFVALGTEQATIGRRADIIICDDIVDEDWASSEVMREKLRTWFKKELLERLEPEGRLVVVGTRWHFNDLYAELLQDESYEKLVFPVLSKENEPLWTERWPLEVLLARRKEIGSIAFSAQYLCDPTPMEGAIFKAEWLHYWHRTSEDHSQKIYRLPPKEKLRIFQGWDLAISEQPESDWTVCATVGLAEDGPVYLLDYYRAKIDFPTQVKQVQAQALAWKPVKIEVESNAFQRALPQSLRHAALPIAETRQTKNKLTRLMRLAPYFENGTIRISKNHDDFLQEYLQFPKGEHDDILDALKLAFTAAKTHLTRMPGATVFIPPAVPMPDPYRREDKYRFLQGSPKR